MIIQFAHSVDQEIVERTLIVTPGHLSTYDRDSLEVSKRTLAKFTALVFIGWIAKEIQ